MHSGNWDDLKFLLAVAEAGSVAAAGRALGVNHATVLRRVAAAERDLGISVFERSAAGYVLPADNLRLIEALREVEAAVGAVERIASGARVGGQVIRVTSTDSLCQILLPDIVAELAQESGDSYEIISANAHVDFARLHADIAVRPAVSLPDILKGEVAGHLRFHGYGVEGAKGWLSISGPLSRSLPAQWLAEKVAPEDIRAGANSFVTLGRLAATGLGRAVLPDIVARQHAALQLVSGKSGGPCRNELRVPIWVASHADTADAPRLKRIRKALAKALAERLDG